MKSSIKKRIKLKGNNIKVWKVGNRHNLTHKKKKNYSHILTQVPSSILFKNIP